MSHKASGCCGACSIAVEGEPALNALCHCANCKRRTGCAFGWSANFSDAQIRGPEQRASGVAYLVVGRA